ncbi:MAG: efflux RND transporter permease subunit [Myxococcota bacterium]
MIWNFCIRRPVLTIVIFLAAVIFGIYGYTQMPIRENPDVEFPIVSVSVVLPGAEPEVIETEVIEPLESEINTIEGLKELRSTAREQVAEVTAEFELYRDIDVAAQDVRDRVDRARQDLPDDIEAPIVRKIDPDAQAILWIALTGDERWDPVRLSTYAEDQIKERLENLRGVGQVQIGGQRRYAVRIRLDPEALAARRMTVRDVVDAVQANNVDIPSGRVQGSQREFLVKTRGQFASPEPLNDLVVAVREGGPVRLRDVGEAVSGVENDRQLARFVGEPSVGLGIVKQRDANTVEVAELVRARIAELSADFPAGLEYAIAADDSQYVEDSIRDLLLTIGLATLLVVVVVLALLRTWRGTFITSLAIPASLAIGLAAMQVMGFSLNVLSMLGLILVIGIVVDDAIVVLESSYRHMEEGSEPVPASRTGTTEVAFPTLANSLSLAAVFIPVAFTPGLIGRFFLEFGLTVAATIFASTFTALTLTPMLCSRILRPPSGERGRLFRKSEQGYAKVERGYERLLGTAFRRRWLTVVLAVLFMGSGPLFFSGLPTEFAPTVDRAEFLVRFETPQGATLDETDQFAQELETLLRDHPEVEHYFLAIGLAQAGPGQVNEGIAFVHLTPTDARDVHQEQIMQEVRDRIEGLPGGEGYVLSGGGVGAGAPLQLVLQNPDLDALARGQEEMLDWMREQPDYVGVDTDLQINRPEVRVRVNRDKAAELGISIADISNTLRFLLGDPDISEIERQAERYDVITETTRKGRMVPADLESIYVRTPEGDSVALGNLVTLEEGVGPSEIHHFNRIRAATLSASTPPGVPLGDALDRGRSKLEEILPSGFDVAVAGQARDFEESFRNLTFAVSMSVIFIFLILAAQFESWIHPLTIMLSLPLAVVGAFAALWIFGMTFNVFSFIGLIMLLGMATKNAILLVDYTNVLRRRGRGVVEAAKEAARIRFRPVIMTTLSTAIGMLPIALGFGAGGRARMPLGVAVIAGLLVTTLLTLVVVPVVYTLMDAFRNWTVRLVTRRGAPRRGEAE